MRVLSLVAAIAMVAALFLPWLNPQTTGIGFTPWDLVKELEPTLKTLQDLASDAPALLAFLATFALAGLFGLLAFIGAPSRLLALLAGGGALAMLGYAWLKLRDQAEGLGIPLPDVGNLGDYTRSIPDVFGTGAMAWAGGAVVLLLCAMIGFPARR